ncbi:hypothetical protein T439DRAFT_313583 [Meredithblackwellia eburnea MCA 4105]
MKVAWFGTIVVLGAQAQLCSATQTESQSQPAAPPPDLVSLLKGSPALPVGLWRKLNSIRQAQHEQHQSRQSDLSDQIVFAGQGAAGLKDGKSRFKAFEFDQLVSHFPEDVPPPTPNATFKQRFWYNAEHYAPGGPVILLDGGETSGEDRIPFLESGILEILSNATGGIGVILEHRYYGTSFPVDKLNTETYRFLTTDQSLRDSAHFARNVVFPSLPSSATASFSKSINSPASPWIYYGGSYAGAKAALAIKTDNETWWGAIASSAVTEAVEDYWEYYEPIRQNGRPSCIHPLIAHSTLIDHLLTLPGLASRVKTFFGLGGISNNTDFVNTLAIPLGTWQGRNWDGEGGGGSDGSGELTGWEKFCLALEGKSGTNETFVTESVDGDEEKDGWLVDAVRMVESAMEGKGDVDLTFPSPQKRLASLRSYAKYINDNIAAFCPEDEPGDQDACFGLDGYEGGEGSEEGTEEAGWKSWTYQYCTEWGYFIGAPPERTWPSLVSRLITPDYTGQVCPLAFPPQNGYTVPARPNTTIINQHGGYDLEADRLAFVDGSADPWLYATPHSPHAKFPRKDTLLRPFKLIKGKAVHHWDENGRLDGKEPPRIKKIHEEEVEFVKSWLADWKTKKGRGRWTPDEKQ